jgi:hypothetical protein
MCRNSSGPADGTSWSSFAYSPGKPFAIARRATVNVLPLSAVRELNLSKRGMLDGGAPAAVGKEGSLRGKWLW